MVEALSAGVDSCQGCDVRVFGLADANWCRNEEKEWAGAEPVALDPVGPSLLGYTPAMLGELFSWQPDIVHTHGLWMHHSRSVHQWARRSRRPYVVSPHGMLESEALKVSQTKKAISRVLFQSAALRDASLIHATSALEAESCRNFGLRQPIAIIPNGVDLPCATLGEFTAKTRNLLYFGRLHPIKNLELLMQVWKQVGSRYPDWSLSICGPGEPGYIRKLKNLALSLQLDNVQFMDPVYGRAKNALYQNSSIYVLPSKSENFAMTVAEALANGVPVITNKGAPWSQVESKGCGWWVDQGHDSLVTVLDQALSLSAEQLSTMGAKGRAWMQAAYSWDAISQQMADVYRWAIDRREQPDCLRMG